MQSYDQDMLIKHLNTYLKYQNRPLKLDLGYCHGLTLLWLYMMSKGNEDWFYDTTKKIIEAVTPKQYEPLTNEIEKLLSYIEWLQNSNRYMFDVNQLDIDKLLELPRDLSLSYLFTDKQLNALLGMTIRTDKLICISSHNHTIGVFKRDHTYFLFDSNHKGGKARTFTTISELKSAIIESLYTEHKIQQYPLEINIAKSKPKPDINKTALFKDLLDNDENFDKPGVHGITNLYLACDGGDYLEVAMLLEKGADVNKPSYLGISPLTITVQHGYLDVAECLLKHGADPNQKDKHGVCPLFWSICYHHDELAKLLLTYGANPLPLKSIHSPLALAIQLKSWQLIPFMLIKIKDSKTISKSEHELMQKNKDDIIFASQTAKSSLNITEAKLLDAMLMELFETKRAIKSYDHPIHMVLKRRPQPMLN